MTLHNPRHMLLVCAGLDLSGLFGLLVLQIVLRQLSLANQLGWVSVISAGYLALNWLFGTYSLLGWQRMPVLALIRRQAAVVAGMLILVALTRWTFNLSDDVWFVWRTSQFQWLFPLGVWSVGVRQALRCGLLQPEEPRCYCMPEQGQQALAEWRRTPPVPLIWLQPKRQ